MKNTVTFYSGVLTILREANRPMRRREILAAFAEKYPHKSWKNGSVIDGILSKLMLVNRVGKIPDKKQKGRVKYFALS